MMRPMFIERSDSPFQISIGPVRFLKKEITVPQISIVINHVEFAGDPNHILEFFQELLEENPIYTDGLDLLAREEWKEILLKSRVAFSYDEKFFYPTTEFRMIARDLIAGLRSVENLEI